MSFMLFLLVNATLFLRPAELLPGLEALPIYNILIVLNLVVAAPGILEHLTIGRFSEKPITGCVIVILFAIFLSHFLQFDFWSARTGATDFLNVVAYFLILVTVVNTRTRLLVFLTVLCSLILALNVIAVLHYHGIIELPSLTILMQNDFAPETGEKFQTPRMQATGIFGDPNDLSMIIVVGCAICLFGLTYAAIGLPRFLLIAPAGFLVYALLLTQSRGGLLALFAGLSAALVQRLGMKRGLVMAVLTAVPALALIGGRQSDIGGAMTGGTGAARAELWSEGLEEFKTAPFFGIGHGNYDDEVGQVAHNSFVHSFVELGLLGGTAFLGIFAILGYSLVRLRTCKDWIADPALRSLLGLFWAILAAYSVSMLSLSRGYTVPTYLIAGLTASYVRLAEHDAGLMSVALCGKVIFWLGVCSIAFILAIYLYIKFLFRMG